MVQDGQARARREAITLGALDGDALQEIAFKLLKLPGSYALSMATREFRLATNAGISRYFAAYKDWYAVSEASTLPIESDRCRVLCDAHTLARKFVHTGMNKEIMAFVLTDNGMPKKEANALVAAMWANQQLAANTDTQEVPVKAWPSRSLQKRGKYPVKRAFVPLLVKQLARHVGVGEPLAFVLMLRTLEKRHQTISAHNDRVRNEYEAAKAAHEPAARAWLEREWGDYPRARATRVPADQQAEWAICNAIDATRLWLRAMRDIARERDVKTLECTIRRALTLRENEERDARWSGSKCGFLRDAVQRFKSTASHADVEAALAFWPLDDELP